MLLKTVIYQETLAELVGAKEQDGAGKRASEGGQPTAVQASPKAFLPPYRVI